MNTEKFYRLRELIYQKYGEAKFSLGCEIVARWVAFETKETCTSEAVEAWCNVLKEEYNYTAKKFGIYPQQARALQRLFGLSHFDEIFN